MGTFDLSPSAAARSITISEARPALAGRLDCMQRGQ